MTKIKIGHGTFGDIFADLEQVKACNFCKYFKGYGLHALCGHCDLLNKDISGGYFGEYAKVAKSCNEFSVREELLEENINSTNKIDYNELKELKKSGMKKIFISGSSKIKKLNQEMKDCLDEVIKQDDSEVIVGDCYGIDILAQKYLKEHGYERVTVYCSQETPTRTVYQKFISMYEQAKGFEGEDFYQVKDKEMCNVCDSAIAFWNGTSYGVKCNIDRIKAMNKPLTVIIEKNSTN